MKVKGDTSDELFNTILKEVQKQSKGYVAPLHIFKAVQAAVTSETFAHGMVRERELFTELMVNPQSRALQYFFFSERKTSTLPDEFGTSKKINPINTAGVIGKSSFIFLFLFALLFVFVYLYLFNFYHIFDYLLVLFLSWLLCYYYYCIYTFALY